MKQKRIELAEAVVGLQVVVNGLADATFYTIKKIEGKALYLAEGKASGMWVDYSICMPPAEGQIKWQAMDAQVKAYGYWLDGWQVMLRQKATGAWVSYTTGGRFQCRQGEKGSLLWSGPDLGDFLAKYWGATKK